MLINVLNANKMKYFLGINVYALRIISKLMGNVKNYLKMLTLMEQALSVVQIIIGLKIIVKDVEITKFGMVKNANVRAIST